MGCQLIRGFGDDKPLLVLKGPWKTLKPKLLPVSTLCVYLCVVNGKRIVKHFVEVRLKVTIKVQMIHQIRISDQVRTGKYSYLTQWSGRQRQHDVRLQTQDNEK